MVIWLYTFHVQRIMKYKGVKCVLKEILKEIFGGKTYFQLFAPLQDGCIFKKNKKSPFTRHFEMGFF